MRATMSGGVLTITFSARNLLALQHKLEMKGSARTLVGNRGDVPLIVQVETDEEHYEGDPEPPGEMHPQTEAYVKMMTDVN